MTVALYWWRATWRTAWRPALVVILLTGVLGAVSLAAVAGARRTESAYGRYLKTVHASDVMVNIPSPDTSLIAKVEQLPGVRSGAAWAGLDANPVVRGRVDDSFLTDAGLERRRRRVLPPGHLDRAVRALAPSGLHQRDRPHPEHRQAVRSGRGRHGPLPALRRGDPEGDRPGRVRCDRGRGGSTCARRPVRRDGGSLLTAGGHRSIQKGARLLVGGDSTGQRNRRPGVVPSVPHAPVDADRPGLHLRGATDGHRASSGAERHPSPGGRPDRVRGTGRPGPLGAGQPEPGPVAPALGGVTAHAPRLRPDET